MVARIAPQEAPRTVAITGANGFVGSNLVRHFAGKGWNVLAFCRASGQNPMSNVTFREFALPDGMRKEDFAGGSVLIHCACAAFSKHTQDSDSINIQGTRRLLELSQSLGYKKFVYLSSLSAQEGAESHYGRHKLTLEQAYDPLRDLVVRPGLVLGNGSLARSIVRTISNNRFVPLVGGGHQPVYTLGIDELCRELERMVDRRISGFYSLATPQSITMRQLYEGIARKAGVRCVFIPVPYSFVYVALQISERLGIELPVTTENLLGLKHLRPLDLTADLRALGVTLRSFEETIQTLDLA